jgi:hypothetical protein
MAEEVRLGSLAAGGASAEGGSGSRVVEDALAAFDGFLQGVCNDRVFPTIPHSQRVFWCGLVWKWLGEGARETPVLRGFHAILRMARFLRLHSFVGSLPSGVS